MLMVLNYLLEVQSNATIEIVKQITQLSNYRTSHPDAVIEYRRSGMILHIYSDASYISEPEARIRSGRYFSLGPKSSNNKLITAMPPLNGTVHVEFGIIRNIVSSVTEAELVVLLGNCQKSKYMWTALS